MKVGNERLRRASELSLFGSLGTSALVICGVYFGKPVLVPFALALLLSFLLAPPVNWLEKLKLGRALSTVIVLAVAITTASGILWLGFTQLAEIVNNLPHYQTNIQRKIEAMRNPAGSSLVKLTQSIEQVSGALTKSNTARQNTAPATTNKRDTRRTGNARTGAPLAVELVDHPRGFADSIGAFGMPVVQLLESAAAVSIFTLFMLLQRSDLRNRLFRLFGAGHLNTMTTAMDDAARRVSRYLLTQSIVNASFGGLLGAGLYVIGVPNASFWGVLGAVLRFIPYVGTLIAGACPLILALAVFEGWAKPLQTLGLFAVIEMTISAGIEPWLYGAHTGISSLAILVSAAFWTLLWGPIGLVLSTPMTVCLLVLGRYVAPLKFLGVLLGDEPVLPPEACYYQRLLALDEGEAREIAEAYLKQTSIADLYEQMLVPALFLAEQDRHEHALDEDREKFIFQTTRDLIADLSEEATGTVTDARLSVLCIPAKDEADELVALMLAHLINEAGFPADSISVGTAEQTLDAIGERDAELVFVSALPPFAEGPARALCRRIRKRFPDLKLMVGIWDSAADISRLEQRLGAHCFDKINTSLRGAERQIKLFKGHEEPLVDPVPSA